MRLVPATASVRHLRSAFALAAALGIALLAGCGGGGDDDPSEDALRSRLSAAFQRTDDAKSVRTLDSFEIETGDDGESVSGCIDITVEKVPGAGAETERFALQSHVDQCDGPVTGEMVLVGRSLWVSSGDGSFEPARIDPKLVPELTDDGLDFSDLPGVATDVELGDEPTGAAAKDAGPTYEFEAPGSALSDEAGADDADVDFTATTDSRGYLTGLKAEIEAEGANAKVEQAYEEIDQVPPIQPPPRKFVHGPTVQVESEAELKRLIANIAPEPF